MQITDHRLQADDRLAIQGQGGAEHAMRGRVLRSHVDHDAVGAHAIFALHGVALERAVEHLIALGDPFLGVEVLGELQIVLERILLFRHDRTCHPASGS